MATYTSMINSVLRKLREDTVAGPTSTDYAQVIGEFVNEAKREVEDAWKWTALRTTKIVTTADGVSQYAVVGASDRYKLQDTQDKRSVYDATSFAWVLPNKATWMKEAALLNTVSGKPRYFYFEGVDSNGDPYVNFHQTPDGIYTINLYMIVPQDDFSVGTEVVSVPSRAVILGAYAKAIAERGEDSGQTSGEALASYKLAVSDAIAIDEARTVGETTWDV